MISDAEKTLVEIRTKLINILSQAQCRKKTTKWKYCRRAVQRDINRVEAILAIHQNGGSDDTVAVISDSIVYHMQYQDGITFWEGELEK